MPSGDLEILQLVSTSNFFKIRPGLFVSSDLSVARDLSSEKETILLGNTLAYVTTKAGLSSGVRGEGAFTSKATSQG